MTLGVASAVKKSGRKDQLAVIAGSGYAPNMDLIRTNGGQDAGFAVDAVWGHFSALDALNRIFANAPAAATNQPLTLFDTRHNLGTTGAFKSDADFKATFEKVWKGA